MRAYRLVAATPPVLAVTQVRDARSQLSLLHAAAPGANVRVRMNDGTARATRAYHINGWYEMNPYEMLGSGLGTNEATLLSARLSAWHDAMVAHERRLRTAGIGDVCDEECPHAEASALWSEAILAFGPRAHELTFLRSRANEPRRSKRGAARPERLSEAADRARLGAASS